MFNQDGPTPCQERLVDVIQQIGEACKDFLMENCEEIDHVDLHRTELKNIISCPYWKKELVKTKNGKTVLRKVKDRGPVLYSKLNCTKGKNGKEGKIWTHFYEMDNVTDLADVGKEVNPLDLLGMYCFAKAVIKLESIYIGGQAISIQIRVHEANIERLDTNNKRLLCQPEEENQTDSEDEDEGEDKDGDVMDIFTAFAK